MAVSYLNFISSFSSSSNSSIKSAIALSISLSHIDALNIVDFILSNCKSLKFNFSLRLYNFILASSNISSFLDILISLLSNFRFSSRFIKVSFAYSKPYQQRLICQEQCQQKQVQDAYYSRSQRGFKMGSKPPYGFHSEPIKMDGINTKKLVVNPDKAEHIKLIFEMYADPKTSYGDITQHFAEQGILFYGKELIINI
ncbi:Conserved hypothetical protein [Clostridium kluyveri DSM 555]|uniref:Recombinase domain-containing protein n=1 Tax=Clostridium kluyveri (strain ATCC 8527 / DSM 555 / NBRC 12016 / NCIMB 10680 / K1) TaxID=431943 RepID=A5N1Q0_CLOK5|nr:Conserved hypothetical protein [Clostridium kluyveri DSM 555]